MLRDGGSTPPASTIFEKRVDISKDVWYVRVCYEENTYNKRRSQDHIRHSG